MKLYQAISLFLIIPSMLVGCATAGVKIDQQQAAAFQPGIATYADIIAKFGKPSRETMMGNGSRTVAYVYVRSTARPQSFIPVVGAFVGGADQETSSVAFRFAPDGKLIDHTTSSGQIGVGTGLAGG